jgi:hypothetical protein
VEEEEENGRLRCALALSSNSSCDSECVRGRLHLRFCSAFTVFVLGMRFTVCSNGMSFDTKDYIENA